MKMNRVIAGALLGLVLGATPAIADTDPFPGVALGGEVGARQMVSSSTGMPLDGSAVIECPAGTGRGIVSNATTHETYVVCTKTWRPSADVQADIDFRNAQDAAVAAATAESQAWAAAHPGQQKCIQWGPVVHANGVSTASGGVCANPVPVPVGSTDSSTTVSTPAPTVSETTTPVIVSSPPTETTTVSTPAPSPIPSPTPAVAPAPSAPVNSGVGGWAVIDANGKVYGVVVCDESVCGVSGSWHGVMPVEYMGCPAGCRLVLQTSADPQTGNVAGWRSQEGTDVTYNSSTNTFAVQQTNQSAPSVIITPPSAGAPSFATVISRETSTVLSDTSTVLSDTRTATTETLTAATLATIAPLAIAPTAAGVIPLETDGEEITEPPAAEIAVARESTGKYLITLDSNLFDEKLTIRAYKKGAKVVVFNVATNEDGLAAIRTSRNLSGYKLSVYTGTQFLDSIKAS